MPKPHSVTDNYSKVVELLRLEAGAIERAAVVLDRAAVEYAVDLIAGCKSKVIVIGVGKSGVIAQKIAQTLTSTGTVAVFVHPSDALHGSLGVISNGDVVIALSNSGETDEIIALLPAIEHRSLPLIAIVGRTDSTLARRAEVILDASVDKEACPLNLAPTTSTTVALAIGDALAMTVMESKGLTAEDFAANHPAGRLGKRLTLRVENLMHKSPGITADAGWIDVVKAISQNALGAVNIIDAAGRLIGIVTDGDLRRTIERTDPLKFSELNARQMMTAEPVSAAPQMLAFDALRLMEDRPSQISVLPVVDEDRNCLGLLRLHDVVRSGL
ncbi:MAG TPA: KpsF/GutQ family sugar-phosphate isomerase [Pyrinomonadaceae bacterium]|nr:KpsF/GutQ family sugar-phosphate isomerase [Pyrinomonadaceae bacterium]